MSSSTSASLDVGNDGTFYQMTLRTDRPIEGCELSPYPFLYLKGGTLDNGARQKKMDSNPHKFSFRWFRKPRRQICQNNQCPRRSTYDPVYWTKTAIGGSSLRCATCEKAGVAVHLSLFCSSRCFRAAYSDHCASKHPSLDSRLIDGKNQASSSSAVREGGLASVENESTDANSSEMKGQQFGMPIISDDDDWVANCVEKEYIPVLEDVGCILKVEVSALSVTDGRLLAGPMTAYTDPVLSGPRAPPKRRLLVLPAASPVSTPGAKFRVISYNILAELYATKQMYPYCDSWCLSWPYRWAMIRQELEDSQGDIICLQEVQSDHYEIHINPFMQSLGYEGSFKQKSRESMGQYGKVDGCVMFYRRSKFVLVESYALEFNDSAREAAAAQGLDDGECRKFMNRLSKDNVAQIFILEAVVRPTQNGAMNRQTRMSSLCLVNTHLYSNHTRPDVKLWQCLTLMREVQQISTSRDLAVIVCGDFNSEPESAVHEYMATGSLEQHHPELNQTDDFVILPPIHDIAHSIELASAMQAAIGTEPLFTNFTANFKGTLDYIWYTPSRLRLLAVANIPDPADIFELCGDGLPSACYPSDHIMLCTDMAFVQSGTGSITRSGAYRRGLLPFRADRGKYGAPVNVRNGVN